MTSSSFQGTYNCLEEGAIKDFLESQQIAILRPMDVEISQTESNPQLEPHHIYLRNGQVISVMAYRFRVHLNKQTISFYNSETDRNKKVFWQLPEITGVVASSALAELPPIVQMQKQIDAVITRMDAFDNSLSELKTDLGEIVMRAVRAAISQPSAQS